MFLQFFAAFAEMTHKQSSPEDAVMHKSKWLSTNAELDSEMQYCRYEEDINLQAKN